jgi:adenylate cyclase
MSFFNELKRRNVFKVGVAYAVATWLLLQIVDLVLENIQAPDWIMQVFMLAMAVGFPIAIIIAWAFEVTPDGVKLQKEVDRDQSITPQTGQQLNRGIIMILIVAVVFLISDKFRDEMAVEPAATTETTSDQTEVAKSIAVLPFVAMSSGPDDEYFADGLTEEILNSLAQLPELLVTARTSAFSFKGQDINVQEIARKLGVNHIVEGSVRRSGERLRVTAQLIRAEDGFHLWSENYDSTSEDTISVQEDIAEKIADAMNVVMNDTKRELMRNVGLRDVEAFIAYQKGTELYGRAHGDIDQISGLQRANEYYQTVIDRVPDFSPAYLDHSDLFIHILMDDSTGYTKTGVSPEMKESAYQNAEKDLLASLQNARTAAIRDNAAFDLAFVSGNWRGITGKLDKVLNNTGCKTSSWFDAFAPVFGYAQQAIRYQSEQVACDPLQSQLWLSLVRTKTWMGDYTGAIDTANQAHHVAPGNWLNIALILALTANGEFEEAEKILAARIEDRNQAMVYEIMLSAARNDAPRANELFAEMLQQSDQGGFDKLLTYAWVGDREAANQLAASIDQHRVGPLSLSIISLWCTCGSPWDLSATPNFAATLEEANLPWPPASPIKFPMKDW